jgi:hypothetical protein
MQKQLIIKPIRFADVRGAFFKQPLGADCIGLESDFGDAVADRVTALIERGYKP